MTGNSTVSRRGFLGMAAATMVSLALALTGVVATPDDAYAASTRKGYTISAGNTAVYSNTGLTKKYGAIYGTDEVTVITVTGSYTKVTYPISGGKTKTGYVKTGALLTATGGSTYKSKGKFTTYKRPGGASYGYVATGDSVMVLGTSGGYTQIKYPVGGGYKYAFATTANVNTYLKGTGGTTNNSNNANNGASSDTLAWYQTRVGKVIANTGSYKTNLDGATGIKGQCVWYVRNRGYEKLGNKGLTGITGNANTWWNSAVKKGKSRGAAPRTNSIACFSGGTYGHVVYVEYYDAPSQTVYFTEGNHGGTNGTLKKLSLSQFKNRSPYGYKGCIYL